LSNPGVTYRVHLIDEATVVERGERLRVWFLELKDGWVRAKDHPAAELEEVSAERRDQACPPGTIWRRTIELVLPAETLLLSRVTTPLLEHFDAMEYLTKERRAMRRHVEETWFIVSGNYRLSKISEPDRFSRARKAPPASSEPR
jgi:hypothetical protein